MPKHALIVGGVVALVLLTAPAARAHVVHIDWKLTDANLVVVAYFNDDLPADDAEVTLRCSDGTVIATGKTDDTGTWKGPKPPPGSYSLTVKALPGHEKTVPVVVAPAAAEAGASDGPSGNYRALLIAGGVTAFIAAVLLVLWVWRRGPPFLAGTWSSGTPPGGEKPPDGGT